jgi:hypothetical protein
LLCKGRAQSSSRRRCLDPYFVSGFIDAEGCFLIIIRKVSYSTGWKVEISFQINLHNKDRALLEHIQDYFGGIGAIYYNSNRDSANFMVGSVEKILDVIIPHFDKYPLITRSFGLPSAAAGGDRGQKQADYILWKKVVMMIKHKEHLSLEGFQTILNIRAALNSGLSESLKIQFPNTAAVNKPLVENSVIPHPQWIAGFTSGEGCFFIGTSKAKTKTGVGVRLIFILVQHIRDERLMRSLVEFWGCGTIRVSKQAVWLRVEKFAYLESIIIPFFVKHPILGVKALDFQDLSEAAELMKKKIHLTQEGVDQIRKIKDGMNKGR